MTDKAKISVYIEPNGDSGSNSYFANILTSPYDTVQSKDLGNYFSIFNLYVRNTILAPGGTASFNIKLNYSKLLPNSSATENCLNFIQTLVGREVTIKYYDSEIDIEKIVFSGYITLKTTNLSTEEGKMIEIICSAKIYQLSDITANASWDDNTKTYGSTLASVAANTVDLDTLLEGILKGTILEGSDITEDSRVGSLPNSVWCILDPSVTRYQLLNQILLPYSRIFYQTEDGKLVIQPLYDNDYADTNYNVITDKSQGGKIIQNDSIMSYETSSNSASIPNRVDMIFAASVPGSAKGLLDNSPYVFCSAPYVGSDNKITNTKYTDVFKTTSYLYNTGKFIRPVQKTMSVDSSLLTNATLLNSIFGGYNQTNLDNSIIYDSNSPQHNNIPQFYAQQYLAEINSSNYNLSVTYDYDKIVTKESPLAKLIVADITDIDYSSMLVVDTVLQISPGGGSSFTISCVPLLTLTGVWFSL